MPSDNRTHVIDPQIFETTVNAAWETWKRGSPQGNYLDMLAAIDADLDVAIPMIERNVIEALALEADALFPHGAVLDDHNSTIASVADWLCSHLPTTTEEG